jgi:hypothetical protein
MTGDPEIDPKALDQERETLVAEQKEIQGQLDELDKDTKAILKDLDASASNVKELDRILKSGVAFD